MNIKAPELDKETRVALRWYADTDGDLIPSAGSVADAHKLLAPIAEQAIEEYVRRVRQQYAAAMRDHYAGLAGRAAVDQLPDEDVTPLAAVVNRGPKG